MGKSRNVVPASHFVNSGEANKRDAEEEIEQKKNKFFEPNLSLSLKPFHQISCDEFRTKTTVAATGLAKPVKITKASKTVTANNLSISVDKSHVIDFFKQVGDIVDVRAQLYKHDGGNLRAHFAYIEFATEEAANKARKLHRLDLLCLTIRLSPPLDGTGAAAKKKKKKKLVMKDIPYKTDKSDVINFFKQAGDIVDVCFFCRADEYSRSGHIDCVGVRREEEGTGAPKTVCLKNVPLSVDKYHVIDFFEDVGDVADLRFLLRQSLRKR
ncbi:hypothetical protein MKW92_015792 [Papaver armeniacum]|nr:hypothetical protein MKW92_015792 [Papaver armeniacum]